MTNDAKDAKKDKAEDKNAQDKGQQESWESLMGRLDKITESLRTATASAESKADEAAAAPDAKQEKK